MAPRPWRKWYMSDWMSDPGLRLCSRAARGTWMDMLAIMDKAEPCGELRIGGKPVDAVGLARIVGATLEEIESDLAELERNDVFSRRRRSGVIYNRRMVRDDIKSRKAMENGKLGGNPTLCNKTENEKSLKGEDKTQKPEARSQSPEREKNEEAVASSVDASADGAGKIVPIDECQRAVEAWNALAAELGLPKVVSLTNDRRSKARQRIREAGGLDPFIAVMARVRGSPHCLGDNPRGWRADFDFVLQPKSFTRLREGFYDNLGGHQASDDPRHRQRAAFAAVGERLAEWGE